MLVVCHCQTTKLSIAETGRTVASGGVFVRTPKVCAGQSEQCHRQIAYSESQTLAGAGHWTKNSGVLGGGEL